jgi:hypothetical protein
LEEWSLGWELWRKGERVAGLNTWRKILEHHPDDKALQHLVSRMEPFCTQTGENDDVLEFTSK